MPDDDPLSLHPGWEPEPWDGPEARQLRGFHARALKPLRWTMIDWQRFPQDGIFGRDREWFVRNEICCVTSFDDEDLVLVRRTWFGFPDPPEWGLASRPRGKVDARWEPWGNFPELPEAWLVPEAAEE